MAKRAFLTPAQEQKMRVVIQANKGKPAKELWPIVIESLKRDIGFSTLQRAMAQVNKYNEQHSSEERLKPWSLGSLSKYPVPPEVIPLLLEHQRQCRNPTSPNGRDTVPLTIWEAMWIARLHRLFEHSKASILEAAIKYAVYEQVWELSQREGDTPICDTTPIDDIDGDKIMENIDNYFPHSDSKPKGARTDAPRAQPPRANSSSTDMASLTNRKPRTLKGVRSNERPHS